MERHRVVFHFPANAPHQALLLALVVLRPIRQVHVVAPLVDIAGEFPRDGSYLAVPGPTRLVCVAVVAGAVQYACDFGRNLRERLNSPGLIDRRVSPRGAYELQHRDRAEERDRRPLQCSLKRSLRHGYRVSGAGYQVSVIKSPAPGT